MWIVFGTKVTTERVPGGRRTERHCEKCGEVAMFYERRAMTKLQLYFIDVLDYGKRCVMACGACGALFATDELGSTSEVGAPEWMNEVSGALGKASDVARTGFQRIKDATMNELGYGKRTPPGEREREREPAHDDPLAEDDAALEAKFRALETKYRIE